MKKSILALILITLLVSCGKHGSGPTIARIDGEAFTEGDFDLRMRTLTDERRVETMGNPEERRKAFDGLLRKRLYALAALKSGVPVLDSLKRRQASMDQRVVTQFYFETYLGEYAGHSRQDIESYYKNHTGQFKDDSGHVPALAKIFSRVADTLFMSKVNLDSFYQANLKNYLDKAHCEVSAIQTKKRSQAETALRSIQNGMKFEDAAAKFSISASKTNQGKVGRVNKGETNYELGEIPAESLLFAPETRLKPGQISSPVPRDSSFVLVRPDNCQEEFFPPLATIRQRVSEDFLREFKAAQGANATAALKEKYKVRLITSNKNISDKEIEEYYKKNKDSYESPESFDLYHIETSSKTKLAAKLQGIKDLEGFKALAAQVSENSMTKPLGGHLGTVKRDFCLPYGIGLLPSLFTALDGVQSGIVAAPVNNADTKKWHYFWLVQKTPRQAKPLDRVRALVKQDLLTNRITDVKPGDSLAVIGNGKVIYEKDVIFLRDEIPPQMRERYTRENLVDYMLTWQLATDEVEALGLSTDQKLQALRLDNSDNFWNRYYEDSLLSRNWEEDTASLAQTFKTKRNLFSKDTAEKDWHKFIRDIAAYPLLTTKEFEIEFNTNSERYRRDTVAQTFAEAEFDVFQSLKGDAYNRLDAKVLAKLKKRFHVKIMDNTLEEPSYEPTDKNYKKAQDMHYDRKLDQALALYGKLREKFPDNSTLQDSVSFGIAQIYIEQERFQQALSEYRRVSYLYPKSENNYKAMFMVGFILSEHLKNDSAAVKAFVQMLAKYPSSDLSDDADWMIRNIRSGGKLMPVLEGDSGWVEPDSAAKKDTLQKQAKK